MGKLIVVIVLCCLLDLTVANISAYGWQIPVNNNSFEEAAFISSNLPSGFKTYASPDTKATFIWDDKMARTGNRSLYISNLGPKTALWQLKDSVPCIEGIPYKIRVWAKTVKTSGFVGVAVRYRDDKQHWLSGPIHGKQNASGSKDWHELVFEIRPPLGASSFDLFLVNSDGRGGEIWFDDLTIEEEFDTTLVKQLSSLIKKTGELEKNISLLTKNALISFDTLSDIQSRALSLLNQLTALPSKNAPEMRAKEIMATQWLQLRHYQRAVERADKLHKMAEEWLKFSGKKDVPYFLCWQNSMTRIWIRDLPIQCSITKAANLEAVKGETEAVQLVIGAVGKELKDIRISTSDLVGRGGTIKSSQIEIHPIGFVHIRKPSGADFFLVEEDYRGWWPDILLDNFAFGVALGDTQPVWISVKIPKETRHGYYKGKILIKPANAPSFELELNIKVLYSELPTAWSFKNIMSFHDKWARDLYGEKWTPELRSKFLSFLLDRRINLASMYGDTDFTWDEIMKAVKAGQNTILLYTLSTYAPKSPWIPLTAHENAKKTLNAWVPKLREKGLLDIALFYGYDEVFSDWFEAAKNGFRIIKEDYPGLQTISTLRDKSYGLETDLTGVVDNFVPHWADYDTVRAETARSKGSKVWWYETVWTIEQPLTFSRLIPLMTYKVKADGFLIWCINRWKGGDKEGVPKNKWASNTKPVENKIFNDWDPWLDGVIPNSSANYIYPGVNGPLSSMRLENFRDGIEDYDILNAARDRLARLKKARGNTVKIARLQKAITIDDGFISGAANIDYRPHRISDYRKYLLESLEAISKIPSKEN